MPLKHRLPRLEKLNVYQVAELCGRIRANDIILLIKVIVSLVGKDQAFTNGFNPKLTLINTRNSMDDPEGICEFGVEMRD